MRKAEAVASAAQTAAANSARGEVTSSESLGDISLRNGKTLNMLLWRGSAPVPRLRAVEPPVRIERCEDMHLGQPRLISPWSAVYNAVWHGHSCLILVPLSLGL